MNLSEEFWEIFGDGKSTDARLAAFRLVFDAPDGPERDGLLALAYHDGVGVDVNYDKAFEYAERAAELNEGVALYLLGFMCENAETPDQACGGPRQKYDHYDAERFMERCAATTSSWAEPAHMWLGDYYMDSARGGDPEVALEHYEAIAEDNTEATSKLSDYYWDRAEAFGFQDEETNELCYKWSLAAVIKDPYNYSFRHASLLYRGVGCNPSFRLARKYYEDAYDFGMWEAAAAIADMYSNRALEEGRSEDEIEKCIKESVSWQRLADRQRARKKN